MSQFSGLLPTSPDVSLLCRSQPLKLYQCNLSNKTTLITGSGGSVPGESFTKNAKLVIKIHGQNDILGSIRDTVLKLPQLFKNEDNFNLLTEPIARIDQWDIHNAVARATEFDPFTLCFMRSFMENKKISLIKDVMVEPHLFSDEPNDTLIVAVSSAVKLNSKQMDQIARKMKRITGSSNLKLENTIDSSLIAGFVISYEKEASHVIDHSVKGQLAELAARTESLDQRIASHGEIGVL